jgi:hypothetical protein
MTEWLGHGALHENPGLQLVGMDDLRVLNGIRLEGEQHHIRLMAGRPSRREGLFAVPVEIRDGRNPDGTERIHSRARALLAETPPEPPSFGGWKALVERPFPRSVEKIYQDVLFHGTCLQGIQEILGYSEGGIAARLLPAPRPSEWMAQPMRSRWLTDPLVLDSAFQLAILWCHQVHGVLSLPSFGARYRQFRHPFPRNGVVAVLEVRSTSATKMVGDFTFLDQENQVVARLEGFEAVLNPSLEKAFRRRHAA